ncbi:hypothetical protein Pmani_034611 [Petrolisthes manimaculis]|uniref:Major facilitator superfamily (MFS) profile domain-containing protein n=1 Tax=Petrolisthes manimaculis TaxID=1843537 RepID=A0AAE1TRE8_9EUCA|nr:hypothetical protein Pmani_034611 [Petrolisthes manimaculis]
MEDDFDTILTKLGTGKWNIIFIAAMSYWYSLVPSHAVAGVFLAPLVNHTCHLPSNTSNFISTNTSTITNTNTHDIDDDSCSFLVRDNTTGNLVEELCTQWDFDHSTFVSTVTSEFQLVCEKMYLRATYQSLYMFGMMVAACFSGYLADRFGRYTIVAISTVTYSFIAVGSAWLPSLSWILAARFFLGIMHPASILTGFILVMEVTEVKMRAIIGISQFITWSFGTILFSGMAYLVREWRLLQTVMSIPCFLFIPCLCVMGESPRWLAVVGQHQRALKELRRAAKWNKVTLPPDQELLAIMQKVQEQALTNKHDITSQGICSTLQQLINKITILFRTPKIRLVTIIMCVAHFVVSMLFYGLTLAASTSGINPFLYLALSGAAELPSTSLFIPIVTRYGRKKITIISYFLCAAVLLVQPLVPSDLTWLAVMLTMTGKMLVSCVSSVVGLYSLELNPTEIRSQGLGASMLTSRCGAFLAPFIISAVEKNHPWVIPVVFGLAALVAGVVILPLWETQNTRLPDTLAELEGHILPPNTTETQTKTSYNSTGKTKATSEDKVILTDDACM